MKECVGDGVNKRVCVCVRERDRREGGALYVPMH